MTKTEVALSPSIHAYRDFASGKFSPVAGEIAAGPGKLETMAFIMGLHGSIPGLYSDTAHQKFKPGPDPPFPVRLYYVLEEVQKDGLENIVSWQPHGR